MMPVPLEDQITSPSTWQLDKRVPVSILLAIFLQTAAVIIWAMGLENRVNLLERTSVTTENYGRIDEKITGIKDEIGNVKEEVRGVKDEVRRLAVRGKP